MATGRHPKERNESLYHCIMSSEPLAHLTSRIDDVDTSSIQRTTYVLLEEKEAFRHTAEDRRLGYTDQPDRKIADLTSRFVRSQGRSGNLGFGESCLR